MTDNWKTGDKIRCIDNDGRENYLTVGKIYTVLEDQTRRDSLTIDPGTLEPITTTLGDFYVLIENNLPERRKYYSSRFALVEYVWNAPPLIG